MPATYFARGRGRSLNAYAAEAMARMPLSRAKKAVAAEHGCTQTIAAAALELLHDGEWHHVGKYAAACGYYDSEDCRLPGVIAHIKAVGGAKKFSERRKALRQQRRTAEPLPLGFPGRFANQAAKRLQALAVASEVLGRPCLAGWSAIRRGRPDYRSADASALWLAYHGYNVEMARQDLEFARECGEVLA